MRILAEWLTWIGHREIAGTATIQDALNFFGELAKNRSELVSFQTAKDKWGAGWQVNG